MTQKLPRADTIPYWRTSRSPADSWIAKSIEIIKKLGGNHITEGFRASTDQSAFLIYFELNGEHFRIVWPVLPTKFPADNPAARIQAATLLFHDVKAKALAASILGPHTAFIGHLLLPNGKSVGEVASLELEATLKLLEPPK